MDLGERPLQELPGQRHRKVGLAVGEEPGDHSRHHGRDECLGHQHEHRREGQQHAELGDREGAETGRLKEALHPIWQRVWGYA